jgi:hypothetical protein
MDNNTLALVIVVILAIVVLVAFFRYRGKSKTTIQAGPFGMSYEGSNPPPSQPSTTPDLEATNIQSGKNVVVADTASGRVRADQIKAQGGVSITRSDGHAPPKA